jgi:hypothetical protein
VREFRGWHGAGMPTPRRPVLRFWLIATSLEVLLAGVLIVVGGDAAIERGLQATGLQFNTDLISAARLVVLYPAAAVGVGLAIAQVAAPGLAVLVVTRRVRSGPASRAAVAARWRLWSPEVGRRRGLTTWALAVATFHALSLATAGIDRLVLRPDEYGWHPQILSLGFLVTLPIGMFLDAGAVFEENGWRGYALRCCCAGTARWPA